MMVPIVLALQAIAAGEAVFSIPPPVVRAAPIASPHVTLDGMSPAGRKLLQSEMQAERERQQAFAARLRAAREALEREGRRNPLDLESLRLALETRDNVEIERIRENSRAAVGLMRRLSPADRLIAAKVLEGLSGAPQRRSTQPIIPGRP